jgi:hypothetical protein
LEAGQGGNSSFGCASFRDIYIYIYILERLHNGSCFGSGVFAWSGGAAPCVERVWL